jgi:hypothetical protein
MKLAFVALASAALVLYKNRYIRIRSASCHKRLRVIVEQAARGHLNDGIVSVMIYNLTGRLRCVKAYAVEEKLVHKAGLELARHGTPDSCILAMHISNYTGVEYPVSTNEIIREAACNFKSTDDSRTVDIVQGRYLFGDINTCFGTSNVV